MNDNATAAHGAVDGAIMAHQQETVYNFQFSLNYFAKQTL